MNTLLKAAKHVTSNAREHTLASYTVPRTVIDELVRVVNEIESKCHTCHTCGAETDRTCTVCNKRRCVNCRTSTGSCLSCDEESE